MLTVNVLGYYDRNSLGDEVYRLAFQSLFPNYSLKFINLGHAYSQLDLIKSSPLVIGGGDLFNTNSYPILKKLLVALGKSTVRKFPVIAVSVGIPHAAYLDECLQYFDVIFVRQLFQLKFDPQLVNYLPDLAFTLPGLEHRAFSTNPKRIGFFLAPCSSKQVKDDLTEVISELSAYQLHLYRFDNGTEDNCFFNDEIVRMLAAQPIQIKLCHRPYRTEKLLKKMAKLDLAVSMYYHAHIFAMITGTPLLSISTTRETSLLMIESGLDGLIVLPDFDSDWNPIRLPKQRILTRVKEILDHQQEISNRLRAVAQRNALLLRNSNLQQ
jgi:polysaccharide pyruvyl transferase WcaK-like protein